MKVLHLDTGRDWRGGQAQILLLLRGLRALGQEGVLAAPPGPLLERARTAGFPVHVWAPRGDLDLPAFGKARSIVARERPDVVHLHSARAHALGVPAARHAGVHAVLVSRRVVVAPGRGPLSRLKYRSGVDRYLCVSRAAQRALVDSGVPAERTVVIPSGVDRTALAAAAASAETPEARDLRAALGAVRETPLLGTVASLTAEKNHMALIDVASSLRDRAPQPRFVWLGEGPERVPLERALRRHDLTPMVRLLGHRADAPALVRQLTALVVPSLHEGFCGAALEAETLGVPVIAHEVGGLPEVVRHDVSGLLVSPEDRGALRRAIERLISDAELRERLARGAPEVAAGFDARVTAERTLAEYQVWVRHLR